MTDSQWETGLAVVDEVYGQGSRRLMDSQQGSPFIDETVKHLFGDVWTLPHLSMREKRLLVIGATTMLGRADLLEVQLAGAIANKELTDEQLDEMTLFMLFYAGAGNTSALSRGIAAAKVRAAAMANDSTG